MCDTTDYDLRYLKGIVLFNECEFYEAHDVWEELWTEYQGPARQFYQGLIQTAVCLLHFVNGNIRGSRKLYHSSRAYLSPYQPMYLELDVTKLLDEMAICCAGFSDSVDPQPQVEIDPDLIPDIFLERPANNSR